MILVAIGMRYKGYCANLDWSYLVDSSKVSHQLKSGIMLGCNTSQDPEAIYSLLLSLQSELLTKIRDGAIAREVYQRALVFVMEKKPELEQHFVKNVGHGVRIFPAIWVLTQICVCR